MLIALLFGIISIFPQILMPELEPDSENFYTARYLLILLSVSCPVIIGQRILNMIYSIRVEDYKLQRISAVGSIYNPQIQISAESETKRSIFREKDKTKRSKKESAQHSKSRNKSFVMTSVSAL